MRDAFLYAFDCLVFVFSLDGLSAFQPGSVIRLIFLCVRAAHIFCSVLFFWWLALIFMMLAFFPSRCWTPKIQSSRLSTISHAPKQKCTPALARSIVLKCGTFEWHFNLVFASCPFFHVFFVIARSDGNVMCSYVLVCCQQSSVLSFASLFSILFYRSNAGTLPAPSLWTCAWNTITTRTTLLPLQTPFGILFNCKKNGCYLLSFSE